MQSSTLYSLLASLTLFLIASASDITAYSDETCQKSVNNLDAVNGYPDGVCTPLKLGDNLRTFQIAKLDPGCAVTLYGPNDTPQSCSSKLAIVAELATCYNSSWVYYSIDNCLPPTSSSIILPTESAKSSTSTTPSTFTSASSPASTSTSVSASPSPNPVRSSNHTGVIVGGIVGGVSVFALIFGIILFCLRRAKPLPPPPSFELSNDRALLEASTEGLRYPEKVARSEMWGQDAAWEIGRNSIYRPPVELPGDSVGEDKKGINPLIKIHMVR